MDNNVLCPLPFKKIYNNLDQSNYTPCCWSSDWKNEKNASNTLPIEYFNGEVFTRIRKEMLEGEKTEFLKSHCGECWRREELYGSSPRTELSKIIEYQPYKNFDKSGKMVDNNERFLQIGINVYGNHCNLQCYECLPYNSSSRTDVLNKLNDPIINKQFFYDPKIKSIQISTEHFNNIVDELVSYASKIISIDIVGGEPMLMKNHFYLLDRLIDIGESKNITINYVTNFTMMNIVKMKKYFDNFLCTIIQWSVDGLKERNHWLRYPTNWEQTVQNATEVRDYLFKYNKGSVTSTITPSLFSITSFKETYDWLFLNDFSFPNQKHLNIINNPDFLNPQHLPQKLKETIAPSIYKISKAHHNQLMKDRDEDMFKLAIEYADTLDKNRGTNWRSIFPEIAQYA
jgi:hypothetical protein